MKADEQLGTSQHCPPFVETEKKQESSLITPKQIYYAKPNDVMKMFYYIFFLLLTLSFSCTTWILPSHCKVKVKSSWLLSII